MSSLRKEIIKLDTTSKKVSKHVKEPKFIPYEPYKAAINPIIPITQKNVKPKGNKKKPGDSANLSVKKPSTSADNVAIVSPLPFNSSDELRQELIQLKKEKRDLEEQLNIQIKVNSDLKKLLVASVGEDLEARVQFLTQDKVKLAHDVHHYVQRLLDDHEELEKLSIQCDVWRSKFLASSLIVDELANWKAVLFHRYDDALNTLRSLLEEQEKIHEQLHNSYGCLKSIQNTLDPQFTKNKPAASTTPALASQIENICLSLYPLLVGSKYNLSDSAGSKLISAGVESARKILRSPGLNYLPANRMLMDGSSMIHRFHPNARFEHLTMNCCKHCSGDIKLI